MTDNLIVIGASHAAAELIPVARKKGWSGGITLIGSEESLPYHRPPLSKAYFQGELPKEKLLIRPEQLYSDSQVDVRLAQTVTRIDSQDKQVLLESGEAIGYTKLVLCTGTRARELPVDGAAHHNVHYLRTLKDVADIQDSLSGASKLLIVGAGYIGLELAASAVKQGHSVVVLEAQDRVLQRVTSPAVSEFYQNLHKEHGVDIRLGAGLSHFEHQEGTSKAILSSGDALEFDCAVIGIGVIPNSELAEQAGLECGNGVIVDIHCKTSDPDIYAIGDVSNHPNKFYGVQLRLESVPNALEQAKCVASGICGEEVEYDSLPWFWSDQYDVKLQTAGLFQSYDSYVVRGSVEDKKFAVFYFDKNELIACDAINSPADFMMSKKLILEKAKIDQTQLADENVPLKSFLS